MELQPHCGGNLFVSIVLNETNMTSVITGLILLRLTLSVNGPYESLVDISMLFAVSSG